MVWPVPIWRVWVWRAWRALPPPPAAAAAGADTGRRAIAVCGAAVGGTANVSPVNGIAANAVVTTNGGTANVGTDAPRPTVFRGPDGVANAGATAAAAGIHPPPRPPTPTLKPTPTPTPSAAAPGMRMPTLPPTLPPHVPAPTQTPPSLPPTLQLTLPPTLQPTLPSTPRPTLPPRGPSPTPSLTPNATKVVIVVHNRPPPSPPPMMVTASSTPAPPAATPAPPTATPAAPTATPSPPTATSAPPTVTPDPPTATPEWPTVTPPSSPPPPLSSPLPWPTAGVTPAPYRLGDGLRGCSAGTLRTRRDVAALSAPQVATLRAAVEALVASGVWASLADAAAAAVDAAHGGGQYLPWHRLWLVEVEEALRRVAPEVTIPYCTLGQEGEGGGGGAVSVGGYCSLVGEDSRCAGNSVAFWGLGWGRRASPGGCYA